jgi:group I intron endonuclease
MEIYKITNKINGKVYIGKDERCKKDYYGSGKNIKAAIKKYGVENFEKQIIEDNITDKHILQEREKYWIREYGSINPEVGYNISEGGNGGDTISRNPDKSAIIKKISETLKGRMFSQEHKDNLKKNHNSKNPETVKKISEKLKGKKKTEEHKKKLSIANREHNKKIGKWANDDNPMKKNRYYWYYNEQTKIHKRIKEGDPIPQGFIYGRYSMIGDNNPMKKLNHNKNIK